MCGVGMGLVRQFFRQKRSERAAVAYQGNVPKTLADGARVDPFSDWAWRPKIFTDPIAPEPMAILSQGRPITPRAKLFFDGPSAKGELSQTKNTGPLWHAPHGFKFAFRNVESFVSIVFDLPDNAVKNLHKHTIYQCDFIAETEWVSAIFVRLNIKHGANVIQFTEKCTIRDAALRVEFDLGFSDLEENRMSGAWLDVMFETHGAPEVKMRDLTIMRCPRGQF